MAELYNQLSSNTMALWRASIYLINAQLTMGAKCLKEH